MQEQEYGKHHEGHVELWNWLFHHPNKGKSQWPGWERNGGIWPEVEADCFACEVSRDPACRDCPIIWGEKIINGKMQCGHNDSPYCKWYYAKSPKAHKKYAALVRDAVWIPYEEWLEMVMEIV